MANKNTHPILKTEELEIGYPNKPKDLVIASKIKLQINIGELVAVIGINGAGKSTLLRSLSGVQPALNGKILIDNENLSSLSPQKLAKYVSLVLTNQPVSKNLSVFELVALGRQPYTNWIGELTQTDKKNVLNALKLTDIASLKHRKCHELSDGQMQKVLIARALAQNTPLIILDEPTTHLDLYHKAYVFKLLKQLSEDTNKAIVFASHEINLAIQLCDKLILIKDKEVIQGSPEQLIQQNAIQPIFPENLIYFDEASASFKIKTH